MNFELGYFLSLLLNLIPYILVWLAGIVFAVINWRKCPQPALLMTLACVLELMSSCGTRGIDWFLMRNMDFDERPFGIMRIVWIFNSVVGAAAWGMMIAAVVGWRNQARPRAPREESYEPPPPFARRPVPPEPPAPRHRDDDAETVREKP